MADEGDALRRLEERLDRAAEAAERLLADAVARAAVPGTPGASGASGASGSSGASRASGSSGASGASGSSSAGQEGSAPATPPPDGGNGSSPPVTPPPAGWQRLGSASGDRRSSELDLLLSLWNAVRDRIPPELQQRLAEAVREVLLAVRALIDWYLERAERPRREPQRVQDIPIL